jgi:uncharacterized iron-regulated membrane protein
MRAILVHLHRYVGLAMAGFLVIAGLTGSVLAFQSELDAWLNPRLFHVEGRGPALPLTTLVRQVEMATPGVRVTSITPSASMHDSAQVFVENVDGASPDANNLFVDPATGTVLGRRLWCAAQVDAPHLIPFLYRLHYSLHMPGNWGNWLMGGIGLAWMLDCVIGFYLTLPRAGPFWRKWRPIWRIKRDAGPYRLNLDLHRAFGLWLWPILFVLALTSVAFNLNTEVFRPILTTFLPTSPTIWDRPAPVDPVPARIGWDGAARIAGKEARKRGWSAQYVERIVFARAQGFYQVRLGRAHAPCFGNPSINVASDSGHVLSIDEPGKGLAGDVVDGLIYPVHSGQVAGLSGRILICITGLVVAMLSITGIYIWWKKRCARRSSGRVGAREAQSSRLATGGIHAAE